MESVMYVPNSYDDILQEAKFGQQLVASAWRFVTIITIGSLGASVLAYFA
jgi:hypothetical protein